MQKWGYKGTETSLNGIINWLSQNTKLTHADMLKTIIKYGEENIPGYKKYGHLEVAASFVAKKIQRNKKFNDFIEWFKSSLTTSTK